MKNHFLDSWYAPNDFFPRPKYWSIYYFIKIRNRSLVGDKTSPLFPSSLCLHFFFVLLGFRSLGRKISIFFIPFSFFVSLFVFPSSKTIHAPLLLDSHHRSLFFVLFSFSSAPDSDSGSGCDRFNDSHGRSSCKRHRFRGGSPVRVLAAVSAASDFKSRSVLRSGGCLGSGWANYRRDSPQHTAHACRRPEAEGGCRLRPEAHSVRRALWGDAARSLRFSWIFNCGRRYRRRFGCVDVCFSFLYWILFNDLGVLVRWLGFVYMVLMIVKVLATSLELFVLFWWRCFWN